MPLQAIPGFCSGSYVSRARGVSYARTVNFRCENSEDPNAKSPAVLFPRSGKRLFSTLPTGPVQGCWANKSRTFWVSGGNVYELFQDGTTHFFGSVAVGGNPATMRGNGNQLLICSAGNVYVATGTSIYQPIVNYTSGVANSNGLTIAVVSSNDNSNFSEVQPGDLIMLDNTLYTVATVAAGGMSLTVTVSAGVINGLSYQIGAGLTSLLTGAMVEFIDGYFIVNVPNTRTYRISNLFDGSRWDALDFQSKSGSVDNIAAIIAFSGYLALVGDTNSAEIWGDSGNAQFPFARVSGQSLNVGTAAAWSLAKLTDGSVIWLLESSGGEFQIVRSTGGAPARISDHGLENAMRSYPLVYDAVASTYVEGGSEYFRIDFPTANKTWEWNKTNPGWVELGVSTPSDEVYGCDHGRFRVHVTWPNGQPMDLVGDYASGKVWQVSEDFQDDDGIAIPVMRIAPHLNTNLERMNCPSFALDCELGTINPLLVGPDGKELIPTVSLSYSDDGARTWTEAGAASLGRVGEYQGTYLLQSEQFDTTPSSQTNPQVFNPRPLWSGLGSFWISRTYKIKSTAAELRAVYNGLAEVG